MDEQKLHALLARMGVSDVSRITPFRSPEDDEPYNVWKIDTADMSWVLKQAKGYEMDIYPGFFRESQRYAPRFLAAEQLEQTDYLLMEYIPGHDLMRCSREDLILALDSLIEMQSAWWDNTDQAAVGQNFQRSLTGRENRMQYLADTQLEHAYQAYLDSYKCMPRTLCHDDLLPFNVLVSHERAVFVDWEVGGILPYPTSLARLLAHCESTEDAFFCMRDEDKDFAVEYYYQNLLKPLGYPRENYRRDLDLCLLYEFCEWVYVGRKYGNTDSDRFRKYWTWAKEKAVSLGY